MKRPYSVDNTQLDPSDCAWPRCAQGESAGRRATFAFSARFPLRPGLALRLTPGWQRISLDYSSFSSSVTLSQWITAHRWELPVAAEWRLAQHVRPALGGVLSVVTGERSQAFRVTAPGFGSRDGYTDLFDLPTTGIRTVAGAMADVEFPFRHGPLIIAPAVRYTRWFSKHFGRRGQLGGLSIGLSLRYGKH